MASSNLYQISFAIPVPYDHTDLIKHRGKPATYLLKTDCDVLGWKGGTVVDMVLTDFGIAVKETDGEGEIIRSAVHGVRGGSWCVLPFSHTVVKAARLRYLPRGGNKYGDGNRIRLGHVLYRDGLLLTLNDKELSL